MWSVWLVFSNCGFHYVCPLMHKDERIKEASWWERLTEVETGSYSDGRGHAQFSSVQSLSRIRLFATPWTAAHQASLSITNSGVYPNSCPFSWWCHPTISSSVIFFSSCLQSFPALGSFQMSQFFTSSGQSIGVSALASVLPMNTQGWFPLGLSGLISLQSKGLSRVFSNTTVQKP